MRKIFTIVAALGLAWMSSLNLPVVAARAAAKTTTKPAAKKAVIPDVTPAAAPAPAEKAAAPAKAGEGEFSATIKGTSKEKLVVSKLDPPAAFNLEDIQNFPEDRLQPILNVPITFIEGRDFSKMMDFKDDQPIHPWLPDIARSPFLQMKSPTLDKTAKEWEFAIIDQGGATVAKQQGKGNPPSQLTWNGDDNQRVHAAVDTVYIPQLNTVDKESYHHTYMGEPIQFATLQYTEGGKTIIELSSKRLFQDHKAEFSKEAPIFLDKVCDVIREGSHLPFAIQPYDSDSDLARRRQEALSKYFQNVLFIPESQIVLSAAQDPDKRGTAMAIISNAVPGGSGQ